MDNINALKLANILDVSYSTATRYLKTPWIMRVEQVQKLANYFNKSTSYVVSIIENIQEIQEGL